MTKETADTIDLLRRFAEVIPSIPAKAVSLMCETTAATIHFRAALLPQPPQEPRPEQPSPYATVNAMGHKSYEGQVTVLPGRVLRVQAVELDRSNNIVVRIVDVHAQAVHSVEWATEEQHQRWRASLDRVAAERRAGGYRSAPLLADIDDEDDDDDTEGPRDLRSTSEQPEGKIFSRDGRVLNVDNLEKLAARSNKALKKQKGGGPVDKDHELYGGWFRYFDEDEEAEDRRMDDRELDAPSTSTIKQALHDALDDLGVDARTDSRVLGLAVEHRGIEMTLSYDLGDKPWRAHCYVEQPLETEQKLIEAAGRSPDEALDECADAVEEEESDG